MAVAVAALLGSIAVQPIAGARADDSPGLPVIEGPQDQTVLDGEDATFTSTIDRSATIEWWGELAGQSDFSKMYELGTFNGKYTIIGSPHFDGLQIKAIYTVDGATFETEPATMHVLSADDPIEVTDEDTSIGGDAYFTVLNASTEPLTSVQWQQASAGDADDWADLAEDADHEGVTTPELHLGGDATALDDNGRRFRAVFTTGVLGETQPKALADNTLDTNIATLTVDNVRISAPKVVESEPGQQGVFPLTIDWPGYDPKDLRISWEYSDHRAFTGWPGVRSGWYGTGSSTVNPLTIDAANYGNWRGWFLRARVSHDTGGKQYLSPEMTWHAVAAIDQTQPADASVTSGTSVEFTAAAPADYTSVTWQKQSPAAGSAWQTITAAQPRDLKASLLISKVTMADNGYRYRPTFATDVGQPHYGRAATLTVRPTVELTGIFFIPQLHGYRYYVGGVDQNLPNGMNSINGKSYFVRDGSIMVGDVTNPAVPGGRAVFSLTDGLQTSQMIRYGNALRYVDANGAMKLDGGEVTFDGNRYVFDEKGLGVRVVSEKALGNALGGMLLARVVEVDGFSTFVQFSAAQHGSLGGLASDVITVTIGDRSARFTLAQDADLVADQLTRQFARFGGQTSIISVDMKMVRSTGTELFSLQNSVDCASSADAAGVARGVPVQCTVFPLEPDSFQQHLQNIWTTTTDAIRNTTPEALRLTVGATIDAVRVNVVLNGAEDFTNAAIGDITAQFEPLALLTADQENFVVRPQIEHMHAETVAAFREEIQSALALFNARDTDALAVLADDIRPEFAAAEEELAGRQAFAVRGAANTAVATYVGADYPAYATNLNAAFVDRLDTLGPTDPSIIAAAALSLHAQTASDYEETLQSETDQTIEVYREMLDILQNTPGEDFDGNPITPTFAALEALARQTLGLG